MTDPLTIAVDGLAALCADRCIQPEDVDELRIYGLGTSGYIVAATVNLTTILPLPSDAELLGELRDMAARLDPPPAVRARPSVPDLMANLEASLEAAREAREAREARRP